MLHAKTTQCTKTKRGGGELRKYLHNHKIAIFIVPTARRVSERSDRALQSVAKPSTFQSTNKPRMRQEKQRRPKKAQIFSHFLGMLHFLPPVPSEFSFKLPEESWWLPTQPPMDVFKRLFPPRTRSGSVPPVLSLSAGIEIDRARASAGERRGGCICTHGCDSKPSVLTSHRTNRDAHIMRFQNAI